MRTFRLSAIAFTVSAAAALAVIAPALHAPSAQAQAPQEPAKPKPYTPVAVTPPAPASDPTFEAFRKQLAEVAQRKDRVGLGRLVVAQGFFWQREGGDGADKKKSGIDNLAAAFGLDAKQGIGWDMLSDAAEDPTLEPSPERSGVMCAPAEPKFDLAAFEQLTKATGTDDSDWAFPVATGVEVRGGPQPHAAVIEKLGLHLVWVLPEEPPPASARPNQPPTAPPPVKIVTPTGKVGYVAIDTIAPIGSEQLCYLKDASGWKIAGFIGGEQ